MSDAAAYLRPQGLQAALSELAARRCRPLAGATDLFPSAGDGGLTGPILDLGGIDELQSIERGPAGVRIGACSSWTSLIAADLPPAFDGLKAAAREVGGRQIQNAGTLGGNLCNASPAADGVPPLLTLGAEVELASLRGVRRLALSDFITGPRKTALAADELLVAIHVPASCMAGWSSFAKLGARAYLVISVLSVAVRLLVREGRVADIAVAIGAASPVARRLPGLEAALIGAEVAGLAGRVPAGLVAAALAPIDDIRASADYRLAAADLMVRRALQGLGGAGGQVAR